MRECLKLRTTPVQPIRAIPPAPAPPAAPKTLTDKGKNVIDQGQVFTLSKEAADASTSV